MISPQTLKAICGRKGCSCIPLQINLFVMWKVFVTLSGLVIARNELLFKWVSRMLWENFRFWRKMSYGSTGRLPMFSVLSLQHCSDFWKVHLTSKSHFPGFLFLSNILAFLSLFSIFSWIFHPVLLLCLHFVSSSSCHTLLALSCCCLVPDSSQGISSHLLAQL